MINHSNIKIKVGVKGFYKANALKFTVSLQETLNVYGEPRAIRQTLRQKLRAIAHGKLPRL